jgi:hypothetical protein
VRRRLDLAVVEAGVVAGLELFLDIEMDGVGDGRVDLGLDRLCRGEAGEDRRWIVSPCGSGPPPPATPRAAMRWTSPPAPASPPLPCCAASVVAPTLADGAASRPPYAWTSDVAPTLEVDAPVSANDFSLERRSL